MVDGALSTRVTGSKPRLAGLLAEHFTVYRYDRRGRGDSGDTQPYAVKREIEDLDVLIEKAGGSALVYGHSSGGCLALDAAAELSDKVRKLAIYEPPYNDDPKARAAWTVYIKNLSDTLADDRRGDAVALFLASEGTPAAEIEAMRQQPFWAGMEGLATTLAHDHMGVIGSDCGIPTDRARRLRVPTLVMAGGASYPFMLQTATTLSKAIPDAKLSTLDGQGHVVDPESLAPLLVEFFAN